FSSRPGAALSLPRAYVPGLGGVNPAGGTAPSVWGAGQSRLWLCYERLRGGLPSGTLRVPEEAAEPIRRRRGGRPIWPSYLRRRTRRPAADWTSPADARR
ncbi:unnamed protein product, partial [Symbiodinium microadriaticum]